MSTLAPASKKRASSSPHPGPPPKHARTTAAAPTAAPVTSPFLDFGLIISALQSAPEDILFIDAETLTVADFIAILGGETPVNRGVRVREERAADNGPQSIGDWLGECHDTYCLGLLADGVMAGCVPMAYAQENYTRFLQTCGGWDAFQRAGN
ncbi:hypothetical protein CYLTODRAFT_495375 [Cylindrobasidium torrendii FP15055 ss-10]|uniref:Uncharacterized protein n=1 Tax=Cylindrobasidium torrendii FP15055 ss-10 TaxID=1314674 RepID=A0A0D7ATN7_9AGAR|nr:hypothetical protein CYLTODRAFT_495375 [Cylindrobasidium torrendii FP15055 ss-10]